MPEIPDDPAVLVDRVCRSQEEALAALWSTVGGLAEEPAGMPPAPGEWSAKQTLAHLCACEAGFRWWAMDVLLGREAHWIEARWPEQFAGVLATAPALNVLMGRLEREMAESRAFVAALTPEHRAFKPDYRAIALMALGFADHVSGHIDQIERTAEAVRAR